MKVISGIEELKRFLLDIKIDIYKPVKLEQMNFLFYRNGSIVIEPQKLSDVVELYQFGPEMVHYRINSNWQIVCDVWFENRNAIFKKVKEKYNERVNRRDFVDNMHDVKIQSVVNDNDEEVGRNESCFPIEIRGDVLFKVLCE